jgi:hypothetical protein
LRDRSRKKPTANKAEKLKEVTKKRSEKRRKRITSGTLYDVNM